MIVRFHYLKTLFAVSNTSFLAAQFLCKDFSLSSVSEPVILNPFVMFKIFFFVTFCKVIFKLLMLSLQLSHLLILFGFQPSLLKGLITVKSISINRICLLCSSPFCFKSLQTMVTLKTDVHHQQVFCKVQAEAISFTVTVYISNATKLGIGALSIQQSRNRHPFYNCRHFILF